MRQISREWRLLWAALFVFSLRPSGGGRLFAQNQNCGDVQKMARNSPNADKPMVISISQLRNNAPAYFGKTVTVDGEFHREFTDKVFTIEGGEWPDDFDVLVISTRSKTDSVMPLEGSVEEDKEVRITGVVEPYDRANLECAYGPLRLESHEDHVLAKSPVLVIDRDISPEEEREKPLPLRPTNPDRKP